MPCAGSPGGLAIAVARLREDFKITVQQNPGVILESEYQEQWGELAWLLKTREDLCFFVGMGAMAQRQSFS